MMMLLTIVNRDETRIWGLVTYHMYVIVIAAANDTRQIVYHPLHAIEVTSWFTYIKELV